MQSTNSADEPQTYSGEIIAVVHAGFILTGVITTLLGPLLPALSTEWSIDDRQSGYLFTAQFAGSMTGVAGSSRVIARLGMLRSLPVGFAIMSAGVGALGFIPWPGGVIPVFVYGVGLGLTSPATNLFISEINPNRRAAALNILNFAWSAGAVAGTPVVGYWTRDAGTAAPLAALAALLAVTAVFLQRACRTGVGDDEARIGTDSKEQPGAWQIRFLVMICALSFFYVGTENAIGGWVASYALRLDAGTQSVWAIAPSVFWGALLIGRVAAPALLRYVASDRLVLIGLLLAVLGIGLLLSASGKAGLLAGTFMAGAGFASVFPNTLAALSQHYGRATPRAAGVLFMMTGLGGATIPWVVGFISKQYGSLRLALLVTLLTGLVMIALQIAIIFRTDSSAGTNHITRRI